MSASAGRIYLSPPHVGEAERAALLAAFDSNWIAPTGPHLVAFERAVCERVGVRHAVALASGTAALHLALQILGVGPGDEVVTSTLTFVASANAICYLGATPVFVDADADTWNLSPARLEEAIADGVRRGKPPKAVVAVDLYGQCADYDRIAALCRAHDIPLVEDAAEALGASYRGRAAGALGDAGVFSFNGNKIITTSGGGMLVSDDGELVERARYLATQARQPVAHYEHTDIGYNYRLSNLLAALGTAQLAHLDDRIERRRRINARYREALALPGLAFMPEAPYGRGNAWLTCLTVDAAAFGATAAQIQTHLAAQDIEARPVWKPMHLQPVHAGRRVHGGDVARDLYERGVCLPSGSSLTPAQQDRVIEAVRATPREARAGGTR
jgi:dTDP-4-amino-4,6-dideoxygalactose transaminase